MIGKPLKTNNTDPQNQTPTAAEPVNPFHSIRLKDAFATPKTRGRGNANPARSSQESPAPKPAGPETPQPPGNPFDAIRLLDPFGKPARSKKSKPAKPAERLNTDPINRLRDKGSEEVQAAPSNPFESVRLLDPFGKPKAQDANRPATAEARPSAETENRSTRRATEFA